MRYSSLLVIILACSVISCYPTYNWRLVQTEQFGWEALFPAKPNRNSRKIIIQGQPKQTVIKIDRYSAALNQMDYILDVISFEGEMPENVRSLKEYVNKMLKTDQICGQNFEHYQEPNFPESSRRVKSDLAGRGSVSVSQTSQERCK